MVITSLDKKVFSKVGVATEQMSHVARYLIFTAGVDLMSTFQRASQSTVIKINYLIILRHIHVHRTCYVSACARMYLHIIYERITVAPGGGGGGGGGRGRQNMRVPPSL